MIIKNGTDLIRYLKEHDKSYSVEGNIVYAPKAFIINTVVQWCYNQLEIKKMQPNEMDFYLLSIQAFIDDQAKLAWDKEGNLVIS